MAFKEIAVLTDVYEMTRANTVSISQKDGEPILVDRIASLLDVIKKNGQYKLTRRWSQIKWEETALLQLEAGNMGWLDYVKEELKFAIRMLKKDIGFPAKDDYREALEDEYRGGDALRKKNDYIASLEDELDLVNSIEFKPLKGKQVEAEDVSYEEVTIDSLKAIIKSEELGVRVAKDDAIEGVQARIEKARKSK